jgi:hypothetical protein
MLPRMVMGTVRIMARLMVKISMVQARMALVVMAAKMQGITSAKA